MTIDYTELFEREAEAFYKETGLMAPGKDISPHAYDGVSREERQQRFDEWHKDNCLKADQLKWEGK